MKYNKCDLTCGTCKNLNFIIYHINVYLFTNIGSGYLSTQCLSCTDSLYPYLHTNSTSKTCINKCP